MNKKQMIKAIASSTGYTQKAAEKFLNAFWNTVESSLSNNEDVTFVGYGTMSVKNRAAKTIRNPKTKQMMTIAAKKVPVFRPGNKLKTIVNQ